MPEEPLYAIIAGAPKSGTTSLGYYLGAHPEVSPCKIKRSHYFTDENFVYDGKDHSQRLGREAGYVDYRDYFDVESQAVTVESTATYFTSLGTPARIRNRLERVKIILIFRDPVARFVSAWRVHVKGGYVPPDCSLQGYLDQQVHELDRMHESVVSQALMTGHYARLLKNWYASFDSEDLLLLPTTGFKEPVELMKRISRFVGVDPGFYTDFDFERKNTSYVARNARLHIALRDAFRNLAQSPIARLPGVSQASSWVFNKALPHYRKAMSKEGMSESDQAVVEWLREYYAGEADALYELTGQRGLID